MFDRLKSLPLTILLTLLIWMYAESQVNSAHLETATITNIPIVINGSPDKLALYQVVLDNNNVSVDINGPQDQITSLRAHPPGDSGIYAYLDVSADDQPHRPLSRAVRFVLPHGITVTTAPQVAFHLVEIPK